ncbi:MAG: hypothetical protein ACLQSR_16345 [Limisphaerales bacterium]
MRKLENFELRKGYAVFCPLGEVSFEEMADLISRAVIMCRKQKIGKLLIDSRQLSGFDLPGITERFNLAARIAGEAASSVKIAHVASPEWVRSGKFSVMVAKNRGLDSENFHSTTTALEWLLQPAGKKASPADRRDCL